MEEPFIDEPFIDEPFIDEPFIDEPFIEEPFIDEPFIEELFIDEPFIACIADGLGLGEAILPAIAGAAINMAAAKSALANRIAR